VTHGSNERVKNDDKGESQFISIAKQAKRISAEGRKEENEHSKLM